MSQDLFTSGLQDNVKIMKDILGGSMDFMVRSLTISRTSWKAAVVYIDGLVDKNVMNEQVIKPLLQEQSMMPILTAEDPEQLVQHISDSILSISSVQAFRHVNECTSQVLQGNAALFIEGIAGVIILGTAGWEGRSIDEPFSEAVVRGPREGFVENLRLNISLIRRRIKDPKLTILNYKIGRRSQTDVALLYINDITNPDLIEEVKSRIEQIDIDEIPESGFIEQLIEDNFLSPFPQVQNTERPDRVASSLMEGRIALIIDGTPIALIVPVTFAILMTSSEDYYERWLPSSLIRLLRYGAAFIALFLPALYIALISYNHGLIPTKLVLSIAAGREGVPFPSLIEALIMEVTLEILREAGLRLPKPIGQAVGIVGGLVIGEAAVQAAIVSPIMVIVVALTAISSFAFPQYAAGLAIRMLRFALMIAASVLGLYGIILMFLFITAHLMKLQSFGVDYMKPFVPIRLSNWKDLIIRLPLQTMKRRPEMVKPMDRSRK
ncbi:spore germination protein [Paenibacillus sp. OAS669]|uniref:spore germination protein n=1 Tax=Paenibacillus sp. OAS669 TaxID=2663821 RepID=UPI001A0F9FC9|nr:spore germination protein [Paenibacillus sp. OAS669]MBE1442856.1 spore germination protein [Paenibacillus sp. OAS669]